MKFTFAILIGLATVLTLPSMSYGDSWEKISAADFSLPNPPDAKQSAVEIDALLTLQGERTKEECALGEKQRTPGFTNLFSDTPLLTKHDLKILAPLLNKVTGLGEKISHHFKDEFKRTRPYDFDSRIQPCVQLPGGHKSYPSSHALISTLDSCVLALVFPKAQNDFKELATELSERRMKIGVHFPSDVRAGQGLGVEICTKLAQDSDFMASVAEVQKNL